MFGNNAAALRYAAVVQWDVVSRGKVTLPSFSWDISWPADLARRTACLLYIFTIIHMCNARFRSPRLKGHEAGQGRSSRGAAFLSSGGHQRWIEVWKPHRGHRRRLRASELCWSMLWNHEIKRAWSAIWTCASCVWLDFWEPSKS